MFSPRPPSVPPPPPPGGGGERDDPRFEQWLRDAMTAGHIDDAGFTAGVLHRLPHRRPAAERRRRLILATAATLGVVLATALGGRGLGELVRTCGQTWLEFSTWSVPGTGSALTGGTLLTVMLGVAGWLAWQRARSRGQH